MVASRLFSSPIGQDLGTNHAVLFELNLAESLNRPACFVCMISALSAVLSYPEWPGVHMAPEQASSERVLLSLA